MEKQSLKVFSLRQFLTKSLMFYTDYILNNLHSSQKGKA